MQRGNHPKHWAGYGGGVGAGVGRLGKGRWQLLGAGSILVLEWVGSPRCSFDDKFQCEH